MNIFIRAYGSHLMGMGHLFRITKIVRRLKKLRSSNVTLLTREDEDAMGIYQKMGVDHIVTVSMSITIAEECSLLEKLLSERYDVCINDQLNTELEIAQILNEQCPLAISFDDLGEGNQMFDHVINVLYPSETPFANEITDYGYMILEDHSALRKRLTFHPKIDKVFVNQGAADTWGAIPDLIGDLEDTEIKAIKVLSGPAFKHHAQLDAALAKCTKNIEVHKRVDSVTELAADCDLAILGAGVTLFEILALGIPVLASTREEKELITVSRLLSEDIVYAENRLYDSSITDAINEVVSDVNGRKSKFEANRNRFDYSGVDRILTLIEG